MTRDKEKCDAEENWNTIWKDILQKSDGTIDIEQLKKELADFSDLIYRHACFVDYATGGVLSKVTYRLSSLYSAHDAAIEKTIEEARKDAIEDYKAGLEDGEEEEEDDDVESVDEVLSNPELLDIDRDND